MIAWTDTVKENALRFVEKCKSEFQAGLIASATHMPENNPKHRAAVLNDFLDAAVGLVVEIAAKYGSTSKELEDTIVESIKFKFAHLRGEHEVKIK